MFATNVFGLIALTQLFIKGVFSAWPHLAPHRLSDFKERKTGHIINLGSIAGREPYAGGSIYCATKHAVNAFTGVLLRELVDTPIRVTEIQPGTLCYVLTRYSANMFAKLQAWLKQNSLLCATETTSRRQTRFTRACNHVSIKTEFSIP